MEQLIGSDTTSTLFEALTSMFNPFSLTTSTTNDPDIFSNLSSSTAITSPSTSTATTLFDGLVKHVRTPAFTWNEQQYSSPTSPLMQQHSSSSSSSSSSPSSSPSPSQSMQTSTTSSKEFDSFYDDRGSFFLANTVCCCILVAFEAIQYIVLGPLRLSEQQHLRETFWDYVLQKTLFVFCTVDSNSNEERSAWAVWFAMLGSTLLLSKLCKDRFEHLSSSPTTKRWPLIKISILMAFLLVDSLVCVARIPYRDLSTHALLILLADAAYVLIFVISVITRLIVLSYDLGPNSVLENKASISYYTDLFFATLMLSIEFFHHLHLLIGSHVSFLMRAMCLMKLHTLLTDIRRRYRRHLHYQLIVQLMETNFTSATKEDIDKFSDECAICWDAMESARKLPCGHLFHNSCLRSWLEQDASCPTCRTTFKGHHQHHHHQQQQQQQQQQMQMQQQQDDLSDIVDDSASESEDSTGVRPHQRNNLFHFDSARYTNYPFLNWLPTISIEGSI